MPTPLDTRARANQMAPPPPQPPPNPWQQQPQIRVPGVNWGPTGQTNPMVPPLPGDPVGQPGYTPPAPQAASAQTNAMAPQAQGSNLGYPGLRVNPSYLPEQWDYKQSPEYQQRLAWAQRDLNRQLLSMGRSDSTGGINAMARQQAEIAGQEIDKQYQRALQANMENYGRYFNANQANYGRTVGEDTTAWDRARYLDETGFNRQNLMGEQDWNRNFQLANMGLGATTTGVGAGNQAGANLANLLSGNGANQASLALARGDVSSDMISRLLNSGFGFADIERLFSRGTSTPTGSTLGGVTGTTAPTLPAYSGAGVGAPYGSPQYSGLPGVDWGIG